MTGLLDRLFNVSALLVYLIVGGLVFAEDALFIGFFIPGETAAIIGGVIASRGHVDIVLIALVVVVAAILGDTVGYEVGRHLGTRLLDMSVFDKHQRRMGDAQDFLRRRGGSAVFLGRFVAFFRAVIPALAGTSRMAYLKFLAFNAAGGLIWGVGFTLLGYFAGNSYKKVAGAVGPVVAAVVAVVAVTALVVWRVRKHRSETETTVQ